jgi:hypothetical protein
MTVRKVVTRSGRGVRGFFPSHKMKAMIPWESLLERDAILGFEFSESVKRYWAQPEKIYYYHNGEQKYCVPDFRTEAVDKSWTHIEVKPAAKLNEPGLKNKLQAIKVHHEQNNIEYKVLDESVLRIEPRLTNLKILAYHQPAFNADSGRCHEDLQKLAMLPPSTIGGAIALLGDSGSVYELLSLGYYSCDLDLPITNDTLIFARKGEGP